MQLHFIQRKVVKPIFYNFGKLCMEYLFLVMYLMYIFQSQEDINMPIIGLGSIIQKRHCLH